MSAARDITEAVLASPPGTVVYGRSPATQGVVWVVVDGWHLATDGTGGPGLLCVHGSSRGWAQPGVRHNAEDLRLLRLRSDEWRIGGAVPSTPAALR